MYITKDIFQISVSQPFGLQVPIKDKFSSNCPSQKILRALCPAINVLFTQKHQIDADFA